MTRRGFLLGTGAANLALPLAASPEAASRSARFTEPSATPPNQGAQRLSLARLQAWESLGYGMFLHFGISTFTGHEWDDGKSPASAYDPDRLDVDQWIQVARDAGMKYAVLCTKHVAGACLWPSRQTGYTVANSGRQTDVVEAFVKACERRGIRPGLYYCSFDNHHSFGSVTVDHCGLPYNTVEQVHYIERNGKAYTTSVFQDFQAAQISELLQQCGPIAEMWIDEPGVLACSYRTFLYRHVSSLQPDCVVLMNGSYGDLEKWDPWFTWPQDLIGYEVYLPPPPRHVPWRTIEGKQYYLPAEVYDLLAHHWFWVEGDKPRADGELLALYRNARARGANLLLDVPPDKHGLVPHEYQQALMRLRCNAGI